MATKNLGPVTAYAYAREYGYTGTEEEFEALMGGLPSAVTGAQAAVETVTGLTAQATKVSATSPAKATYNKTTNKMEFEIPEGNGITSITLAGTSGNVKTYTINFDDGTTTNFEVSDGEITLEYAEENLAYNNGYYEDLTAGSADQLVSTQTHEDEELYTFRTSGGSVDIGNRENDKLVGGTVAWNQLVKETENYTSTGGTVSTVDGIGKFTASAAGQQIYKVLQVVANHKYLALVTFKTATATQNVALRAFSMDYTTNATTLWQTVGCFGIFTSTGGASVGIKDNRASGWDEIQVRACQAFDLTQMFGSTIADALYEMEQAEAGSGVAWFKKYFPKPYYAYDAGSLQSVNVASHDTIGFNAWDEEWEVGTINTTTGAKENNPTRIRSKNFIPVLPNTEYYVKGCDVGSGIGRATFYDANKEFISAMPDFPISPSQKVFTTPNDAYYMMFSPTTAYGTTYNHDICINLSWSGWRNGEYAGYSKHSYPYDETVELRGIPQLVDGKLVYDGDTYESDGTVGRKWGYVDLGTLNWMKSDTPNSNWRFFCAVSDVAIATDGYTIPKMLCAKYEAKSPNSTYLGVTGVSNNVNAGNIFVCDMNYSDATAFKTAMSGVYLVYELATPTTEQATGFTNPQVVDDFGTEEYVDAGVKNETRDVAIPVGHVTHYMQNLRDKLQHLPTLSEEDGDFFIRQKDKQMSLKKVEGEYDNLTAGNAKQLVSTVTVDDAAPYTFRTSGGSVDIGNRAYIDSIVGGTVAFNQLVRFTPFTETKNGVTAVGTADGTVTFSGTSTGQVAFNLGNAYTDRNGHKILIKGCPSGGGLGKYLLHDGYLGSVGLDIGNGTVATVGGQSIAQIMIDGANIVTDGMKFVPQFFDLTQMFGSTIADYIYSLEQANAGAGVAFFKSLFPKPYYAYNAGELMSVKGLVSHDMVGFNACPTPPTYSTSLENVQFDIEKAIRVIKDAPYCVSFKGIGSATNWRLLLKAWTLDGEVIALPRENLFTDSLNTFYSNPNGFYLWGNSEDDTLEVLTFKQDCYIQIYFGYGDTSSSMSIEGFNFNLSWSGTHDGEYEPYQEWSYPLDSDLELRGIPKLDASNNLYYDGDTYESDGTVTRRYGIHTFDGTETFGVTLLDEFTQVSWTEYLDFGAANGSFMSDRFVQSGTQGGVGTMWNSSVPRLFMGLPATVTTQAEAKQWFINNPTTVVYPLAEPTIESADPYTSPQIVNDFGTEEFVIDDTIVVPVPVGHNTRYPANLRDKLQHLPDLADNDGYYMMKQTGAEMSLELFRIPKAPSTNGKYQLTATVSGGTPTYVWEEVTE